MAELAYFWGLAGSTQALLTPDLPDRFPSFLFLQYIVEHGLTVVAALLLPVGLGLHPRPGALLRVTLATVGLAVIAGIADLLTGGDYMYLARPPASPTLLSLLGPWPWYLAGATVVALETRPKDGHFGGAHREGRDGVDQDGGRSGCPAQEPGGR